MRHRIITLVALAMVLTGAFAFYAPDALAGARAARQYSWPKHNTTLDIYVNTFNGACVLPPCIDGRITIHDDAGSDWDLLYITKLVMWRKDCAPAVSCGWFNWSHMNEDHVTGLAPGDFTWSTTDQRCAGTGFTVHTEVGYHIGWHNGTNTANRDDNSFDLYVDGSAKCNP